MVWRDASAAQTAMMANELSGVLPLRGRSRAPLVACWCGQAPVLLGEAGSVSV